MRLEALKIKSFADFVFRDSGALPGRSTRPRDFAMFNRSAFPIREWKLLATSRNQPVLPRADGDEVKIRVVTGIVDGIPTNNVNACAAGVVVGGDT